MKFNQQPEKEMSCRGRGARKYLRFTDRQPGVLPLPPSITLTLRLTELKCLLLSIPSHDTLLDHTFLHVSVTYSQGRFTRHSPNFTLTYKSHSTIN